MRSSELLFHVWHLDPVPISVPYCEGVGGKGKYMDVIAASALIRFALKRRRDNRKLIVTH